MADAADHAWTIAMATASTPLPLHSPPLHHSGDGLSVAARHILLALYLQHLDLHRPDAQLPAPEAAAPTPEAWADTAPEEIAAYLRITCRRFNTALGWGKGTPYPSAHPSTRRTPPPHAAEAPGGQGVLSGRPPGRPRRDHRRKDGPRGPARLRQRPRGAPQRGVSLARPLPVAPTVTRGFTRPRHQPGQEDEDRSGGPPARPPAGRSAPTRTRVQPRCTTPRPDPRAHQQHHPHQRPPPPPYHSTLTRQPSQRLPPTHVHTMPGPPFTQSQGTEHDHHHHHAPVPPDPYPPMPQYYSDPQQLQHHQAPAQPAPTCHPLYTAHHTAPHHDVYHDHHPLPPHPPAPWYHTQPTHPQHHHHTIQPTYRPEYTESRHTDLRTPPWTRGGPRTRTSSNRA